VLLLVTNEVAGGGWQVGRYELEAAKMFDFSYERTLRSVEDSLRLLQVDYVDVIQVHDLEFAPSLDVIVRETLPALHQIKASGKARFIGITGYPLDKLKSVPPHPPPHTWGPGVVGGVAEQSQSVAHSHGLLTSSFGWLVGWWGGGVVVYQGR
jgi:hypothetical protein